MLDAFFSRNSGPRNRRDPLFPYIFQNYAFGLWEEDEWNIVWVGGMWFQDLWTYDFRRTEMCVIPYATQEGEISFCAYNTGVGWRKIVENMHMVAETRDWFQKKGRHSIYAGNRAMPLGPLGPEEIPLSVVQGGGVTRHKTAPHAGTMQLASSGCSCHGD